MSDRYRELFARLAAQHETAFIPFLVLGDPTPEHSLALARALVEAGADALELGLPFSDPVADGPTIQAADQRALAAGTRQADAWAICGELRASYPKLPMGLLVYANLVERRGPSAFYRAAHAAGVDSVLIADVPTLEIDPYLTPAEAEGIALVMIAPPQASEAQLEKIARCGHGYTYVVTRSGVTGADERAELDHQPLLAKLAQFGAPPPVFGFGISRPEHMRAAAAAGAAGAISGSAVVALIEEHLDAPFVLERELRLFCRQMKAATR